MSDARLPPVRGNGPGILLVDPEGRVRFVNESAHSLLRLHSPVETGGEGTTELQDTLSRLQEPEHRDRPRLLLGLRHDRENGSERRVNVEIRPLESGETTVLFHATQEQDPPSSQADLYRMAFEHAEAGMALVEACGDLQVLESNPAFLHLLGIEEDAVSGHALPTLFAHSRDVAMQLRIAAEGGERVVSFVHPRKGGRAPDGGGPGARPAGPDPLYARVRTRRARRRALPFSHEP